MKPNFFIFSLFIFFRFFFIFQFFLCFSFLFFFLHFSSFFVFLVFLHFSSFFSSFSFRFLGCSKPFFFLGLHCFKISCNISQQKNVRPVSLCSKKPFQASFPFFLLSILKKKQFPFLFLFLFFFFLFSREKKFLLFFFSCISFKYFLLLVLVSVFNCFLRCRCSMDM